MQFFMHVFEQPPGPRFIAGKIACRGPFISSAQVGLFFHNPEESLERAVSMAQGGFIKVLFMGLPPTGKEIKFSI
jgi:hypothetical protein